MQNLCQCIICEFMREPQSIHKSNTKQHKATQNQLLCIMALFILLKERRNAMFELLKKLDIEHVSVLLNAKGEILDVQSLALTDAFGACYEFLGELLSKEKRIQALFDIPGEANLLDLCKDHSGERRLFGSISGRVDFKGTSEEMHSVLPLAHISFHGLDDGNVLGSIRLSNFYVNVLFEGCSGPVFCVDQSGKVMAFNRRFAKLLNLRSDDPAVLLGHNISRWIDPSPEAIRKENQGRTRLPDPEALEEILYKDFTDPQADLKGMLSVSSAVLTSEGLQWPARSYSEIITLLPPVDWQKQDVCLELSVAAGGNALPCIIFGDSAELLPRDFPDIEGYLLGPGGVNKNIIIKRQGRFLFQEPMDKALLQGGRYRFYKVGNTFFVKRENQILFSFMELDLLSRESVHLSLYLRPGGHCNIKTLSLRVMESGRPIPAQKFFTSLKATPRKHYLISYVNSYESKFPPDTITCYKLQDMTAIHDRLDMLQNAYESALKQEAAAGKEQLLLRDGEGAFINEGKTIRILQEKADKIAITTSTLLLTGATGTGKEVLARYIHRRSGVAEGPFIKVDCSTLPAPLMESLLFGHERGAYTGADFAKKGLFEQANHGTLFIDEIHNLNLSMQAKLLQFLQDHAVIPVGGNTPVTLDVRIIVASNMDLEEMIAKGVFREDLYYRIAVTVLHLPLLKDRMEDIPFLLKYFIDTLNLKYHKSIQGLSSKAVEAVYRYPWPGNIRELRNAIERGFLLCSGKTITPELLNLPLAGPGRLQAGKVRKSGARKPHQALNVSRADVIKLFRKHRGMINRVAGELDVARKTVYSYFKKQGITPNDFRANPRKPAKPSSLNSL